MMLGLQQRCEKEVRSVETLIEAAGWPALTHSSGGGLNGMSETRETDAVRDFRRERAFLREGMEDGRDLRLGCWSLRVSRSIFWKYFCACVRTCTTVRVPIMFAMSFHCLPCRSRPCRKTRCSSFSQRPVFSTRFSALGSGEITIASTSCSSLGTGILMRGPPRGLGARLAEVMVLAGFKGVCVVNEFRCSRSLLVVGSHERSSSSDLCPIGAATENCNSWRRNRNTRLTRGAIYIFRRVCWSSRIWIPPNFLPGKYTCTSYVLQSRINSSCPIISLLVDARRQDLASL